MSNSEKNEISIVSNRLKNLDNQLNLATKFIDKSFERLAKENFQKANTLVYKHKKYFEANEFYKKAIDLNPKYLDAYNGYARNTRLNIKDYPLAILLYSKIIEIDTNYGSVHFQRGICKGNLGDYIGQIEDYTIVIKKKPKADLYISRAIIKMKVNDHLGIIEDCTLAIALEKECSSGYQYRGESKIILSEFREAILDLELAIKIEELKELDIQDYKPLLFGALKSCGIAKLKLQDFFGALEIFEKLKNRYPNHPLPYKLISETKELLGDMEGFKQNNDKFKLLNEKHINKFGVTFDK